jgi:hypothetical protein
VQLLTYDEVSSLIQRLSTRDTAAEVEVLRGDKTRKAIFAGLEFEKDPLELQALHAIYKYPTSGTSRGHSRRSPRKQM